MRFSVEGDTLYLSQVGEYYDRIAQTGQFKWNRRTKKMEAPVTIDSLEALKEAVGRLPELLAMKLQTLQRIDKALQDQREQLNGSPEPLYPYPVKANLMRHQIVGANMAMIVFGETGGLHHES